MKTTNFEDLVEDMEDPLDPSFLQRIKSINWTAINDKASVLYQILTAMASIIASIQHVVMSSNRIKQSVPLLSLRKKIDAAQEIVRPRRLGRPLRPPMDYRRPFGFDTSIPFEELASFYHNTALNEDMESWKKAATISSAIGAILFLVSQLMSLITSVPEFKQKIGPIITGIKGDAEELSRTQKELV